MHTATNTAPLTRTIDVCQVCGNEIEFDAEGCDVHPGAPILQVECLRASALYGLPPAAPIVPHAPTLAEAVIASLHKQLAEEQRRRGELQREVDRLRRDRRVAEREEL